MKYYATLNEKEPAALAERYYRATLPYEDLAERFSNRTHFYRQFEKVYHTLPGEFRKEFSQNLPEV